MEQYDYTGSTRYDDDDYGSTRRHGSGGYGTANYGSSRYGGSRSSEAPYGRSYGRGNRYVISADTSDTGYGYEDDNEERGYGSDDYRAGLAIDETRTLISSRKVDGTAVYDRDGSRMGTIHNFMVNKRTGQVDYAVLSFGGILGMGTRYYPLPWQMLEYDTSHGGYVVDMDEDDLDEAPSFRRGEEPDFGDRYGEYVYGYYGMRY